MRRNWRFEYACSALPEPAKEKVTHHKKRHAWWGAELAKAETELKEKGLQLRERATSGAARHEMVIDHEYQARVRECCDKVDHHKEAFEAYERYVRAFELCPDIVLELSIDDIAYFGI